MNRCDSRVHLLDCDILEDVRQVELEAESSSSGYDSSEDDTPSRSAMKPSRSTQGEVMIFRSTGGLHDSLALILDMPEMCDVTFLVGRRQVPVYGVKAILATRSRCLYQLILHHQRKAETESSNKKSKKAKRSPLPQKLVINVQDYSAEDFRPFITFVHSGKVKVDASNVIGLLCASVEYGFSDLHAACAKFIQRSQEQGQGKYVLDSAWTYQHKKAAQKLICKCLQMNMPNYPWLIDVSSQSTRGFVLPGKTDVVREQGWIYPFRKGINIVLNIKNM